NDSPLVLVWDAQTGVEIHNFKGHSAGVLNVVFSHDGTRLTSSSYDWTMRVWDVSTTKEETSTFSGRGLSGLSASNVAFSPDCQRLASASDDKSVKVWDAQSGQELLSLKGLTRFVNMVTFSPDGKRLATLSRDHKVRVWDAQTGEEILNWTTYVDLSDSAAFS